MQPRKSTQVLDDLVAAIRCGALPVGTRLATHRDLARQHGIALETASRIYRRLAQMGLTVGETGRGTFVRDQPSCTGLAPAGAPDTGVLADLSVNEPLAPGQAEQLRAALKSLATAGNLQALLMQEPPGGRLKDRAVVATYLLSRGIDVPPSNVLLTNGSQQGLDAALDATTRPGELIAIDSLSYPGMRMLAESRAHEFASIPITADGPDLDALDRACRTRHVRAIYVMPTIHNPLSLVLSGWQRARIVEIARRRDAWIIEDGTYAFLAPDAPPPVAALAPERTVYVASLSKNVATGLRFGYVVAPDRLIEHLRGGLRASTYGSPSIVTAVAVGWLTDGTVEQLERHRRADAQHRQAIARAALGATNYVTHPNSYILWLPLRPPQR
jgi:DNA-binding transcriptional MocR family regulator